MNRKGHHPPLPPPSPLAWRLLCGLFIAVAAAEVALSTGRLGLEHPPGWMGVMVPLLASGCALAALAQRLPWQNALAVGFIVLFFAGVVVLCGSVSGIPFGVLSYSDRAGPMLFDKLPAILPLWWLAILVASRESGRLAVLPLRRHRNYGLFIITASALLAVLMDVSLEAFAVKARGYWLWKDAPEATAWPASPWLNSVGWAITALVMLGFCGPWLIIKRPVQPKPALHSALVWGMLGAYLVASLAVKQQWLHAAVGTAITVAGMGLAWRGWRKGLEISRSQEQPESERANSPPGQP
jgi:uncharacterized membrane protein